MPIAIVRLTEVRPSSDLSPEQGSAWKASHSFDSPPPGRVRYAEGGIRAGVAGESGADWTRAGPRPGRYSCPCLRIVDHHGKLIREQPVGSANHETSDVPQEVLPDPSLEFIVEFDRAAPGAHPYRARRTAGGGGVAAGAGVDELVRGCQGARLRIRDFLARAGAGEYRSGSQELFDGHYAGFGAPALIDDRAIPFEAERGKDPGSH